MYWKQKNLLFLNILITNLIQSTHNHFWFTCELHSNCLADSLSFILNHCWLVTYLRSVVDVPPRAAVNCILLWVARHPRKELCLPTKRIWDGIRFPYRPFGFSTQLRRHEPNNIHLIAVFSRNSINTRIEWTYHTRPRVPYNSLTLSVSMSKIFQSNRQWPHDTSSWSKSTVSHCQCVENGSLLIMSAHWSGSLNTPCERTNSSVYFISFICILCCHQNKFRPE